MTHTNPPRRTLPGRLLSTATALAALGLGIHLLLATGSGEAGPTAPAEAPVAAAAARSSRVVERRIALPAAPTDLGVLELEPTGPGVEVVVLDPASRPVADASIRVLADDGDEREVGTTAADGHAQLLLADRPHVLLARFAEQVSELVSCDPVLDRRLALELKPACYLHLRQSPGVPAREAPSIRLTTSGAGAPSRTLRVEASGEAAYSVAVGSHFLEVFDPDGPREITAVDGSPLPPGDPVQLRSGRVAIDIGSDADSWVRLENATTGRPITSAAMKVVFHSARAADPRTVVDHGERTRDDGRYLALPAAARDLRDRVALQLVVRARGYYGTTLALPREHTSTIRLRPRRAHGSRDLILLVRDGMPVESLTIRDADGLQLASRDRYTPSERIPIPWDGRAVRIELGTAPLLELEPHRLAEQDAVTVDLRRATGALELRAPRGSDPGSFRLEAVSAHGRFSPIVDDRRLLFAHLPPGRVDIRLRGTASTRVPGCPDLVDREIIAGQTARATIVASVPEQAPVAHVSVEYERPLTIFASPAWSEELPIRDWHPAMAVRVRADGSFRFADLPFPPTHVVFHRQGARSFERVVLGVETWHRSGPAYRIPLGDGIVDVRSAQATGSVRVGLRNVEIAARLASSPPHWLSANGPGPLRFEALPLGPTDVLAPPHSGGTPTTLVISRLRTARVPVDFR